MISSLQAAAAHARLDIEASLEDLTVDMVKAAYRDRAKAAHPDAGGSAEAFRALGEAKDTLVRWLESSPSGGNCPKCNGAGAVISQRAWRSLRVRCPACHGRG